MRIPHKPTVKVFKLLFGDELRGLAAPHAARRAAVDTPSEQLGAVARRETTHM